MALEDAFANEAAGKEAHADPNFRRLIHLDEDAESVGTLDTFATLHRRRRRRRREREHLRVRVRRREHLRVRVRQSGGGGADARAREEENETAGARDDDSASASDADDAEVSFATMRTMPPRRDGSSDEDVSDDTNDDDREGAPFFREGLEGSRGSRGSRSERGRRGETPKTSKLAETRRRLTGGARLANRAAEEYADFEDPGYVRVRVPRGDEENALRGRRDCSGTARREVGPERRRTTPTRRTRRSVSHASTVLRGLRHRKGTPRRRTVIARAGPRSTARPPPGASDPGRSPRARPRTPRRRLIVHTRWTRGWAGAGRVRRRLGAVAHAVAADGRDADVETSHERPENRLVSRGGFLGDER